MLLSEIGDKEIVDIFKVSMHGKLCDAEMLFDEQTGVIKSLLIPNFGSSLEGRFKRRTAASVEFYSRNR